MMAALAKRHDIASVKAGQSPLGQCLTTHEMGPLTNRNGHCEFIATPPHDHKPVSRIEIRNLVEKHRQASLHRRTSPHPNATERFGIWAETGFTGNGDSALTLVSTVPFLPTARFWRQTAEARP